MLVLEPTPSYKARLASFFQARGRLVDHADGLLKLATLRGRQTRITSYDFEVEKSPEGVVQTVYLAKHASEDGEVYEVNLSPQGKRAECSCIGFRRHHQCKHADAVLAAVAAGEIPHHPPAADAGERHTLADLMAEMEVPQDLGENAAAMDQWADAEEAKLEARLEDARAEEPKLAEAKAEEPRLEEARLDDDNSEEARHTATI